MLGCKNFSCSRLVFHNVVISVKYREVSSREILPNFIGHCRDCVVFASWLRRGQKREKEEAYVRQVLNCFDSILLLTAFAQGQADLL